MGLFDEITPTGRMQHLEIHLILYTKVRGDVTEVGKIHIRVLVEDEYILYVAGI